MARSGLSGFALAGFSCQPKVAISPSEQEAEILGIGSWESCGECALVAGLNPQVRALKSAFSHFLGNIYTAEPQGWVLAQVAKLRGSRVASSCEELCSPRLGRFIGVRAEERGVGCGTGMLQFNSIKHAGCLLYSVICQVPKKSQ